MTQLQHSIYALTISFVQEIWQMYVPIDAALLRRLSTHSLAQPHQVTQEEIPLTLLTSVLLPHEIRRIYAHLNTD